MVERVFARAPFDLFSANLASTNTNMKLFMCLD